MKFQLALPCLLLFTVFTTSASGAETKGPTISWENAAPAPLKDRDENDLELKESRQITEAHLLIPIPVNFLGGMLVAKYDAFIEQHTYEGDLADQVPEGYKKRETSALGAIYLPHAKEGAPKFFALASRYGALRLTAPSRPMGEYILGFQWASEDTPFNIRFGEGHDASLTSLVRYRKFPGRHSWLFLVGYDMETPSGFRFEVHIPSHVHAGIRSEDRAWYYYAEGRARSRIAPIEMEDQHFWNDGYVAQGALGIRRKLQGIVHLAVEAGMQQESFTLFDEQGETITETTSDFSPWAKLAIETYIDPTSPP
jgi:hypothetical protein